MTCLPMVPTYARIRVFKKKLTTWEVLKLLRRMKRGALQELLEPINTTLSWILQVSCKNARGGFRIKLIMAPMMRVTSSAQK